MDNENTTKVFGGEQVEPTIDKRVRKYQRWISASLNKKKTYDKWAREGDKVFLGDENTNTALDVVRYTSPDSLVLTKNVNFMRKKIDAQLAGIYARNPKFVAKPLKPKLVPVPPQIDPNTGMQVPVLDENGQPAMQDISEDMAQVISQLMNHVIEESGFKSDVKSCIREAQHRPASIIQVGYQFSEAEGKDDIYFRRRSFYDFIIDPNAMIYDGVVRRCRYMGVKWQVSQKEAKAMGLDWQALNDKENLTPDSDPKGNVYQIWDKETNQVVWCPESGSMLAKEPQEWPWQIDGFPFEILKFTEDVDKQFSKSIVQEALPMQEELNIQRKLITDNTTASRPVTLYDPDIMDNTDIDNYKKRGGDSYLAVQGLAGMPNPPMRTINESSLDAEFYAQYNRNKKEMDDILGTSANEQLQTQNTTAKQAEIVDKYASSNQSAKVDIVTDFLNRITRKAVQIMKQTYTTERVTQVTGADGAKHWVSWVGTEILDEVDISVEVGSTNREDSETKKQVALNMLETMANIPGIDITKLAINVLKDNGIPNAEQYKLEQQPMQPQQQPMPSAGGSGNATNVQQSLGQQMSPMV